MMLRIVPGNISTTLLLLLTVVCSCDAFALISPLKSREIGRRRRGYDGLHSRRCNEAEHVRSSEQATTLCCSQRRRMVLFGPFAFHLLTRSSAALAADTLSTKAADQRKLYQGYEQLNYLLDHWTEETTICGRSGDNPYISKNGCERTPLKVMDYLGYKDLNHPLFRAEKTMRRLEPYVPVEREDDFFNAIENWIIAAEEGNGMAFVSSWGEANPGGGKDRVELFVERAKNNVMQARDSLATIVDILEIQKP